MKTIIDAVNELRGEWVERGRSGFKVHCLAWCVSSGGITPLDGSASEISFRHICTKEQFNAMVAEMSEGFEEYKREYEMDKTVTVDGMVYEIGKLYITAAKEIAILVCAASPEEFRVKYPAGDCGTFISTRLAVNPEWTTGTITPAPVELVDGNAYQFDYISDVGGEVIVIDERAIGKYINGVLCGTREYNPDYCKNIIPLVPEVK